MTWTPLITSDMFTGIKTDVMTASAGLLAVALIIVAVGVLYRVFAR